MGKTTIIVEQKTRERLKKYGRKDQTYDQIINELIYSKKNKSSLDNRFDAPESSELLGVKRND